ncbi:MAG: zinc dependent phospholipase C family protein, partial [Promethearchaeota archaeon]
GKNFIHYQDLCEENGKRSKSWHNMQFNQDKSIKQSIIWIDFKNRIIKYQYEPKYNPAIKAQNWAIEARNYLLLEQHNKCTFSLGAMSHYIADCACFLHVICPYSERVNLKKKTYGEMKGIFNKFKKIHDHYEGNIDMRVESEYGNPPLNLNLDPKSEEFFIINYMSILQNLKNNRMNAYEATLNTASEVVKNAHWMYENYDTIMREQWTLAKVGSHNWRNNFNIQENTLKFLHLVESHLNLAIKNIAFALLSIENI